MGRPPKKRAIETPAKASQTNNKFVNALKFLSLITKDVGTINETNVLLHNKCAIASNGVLSAGHIITEDIYACPHNGLMIEALSKCGEWFSITQLDNNRLSIKSDKFKAIVPCVDQTLISFTYPDNPIATIDDKLKLAFEAISSVPADNTERIIVYSFLLNGSSLIATDGKILLEYWHGINLPSNLPIPKSIIQPLIKTNKKLTQFGFSQSSVTFWFEDNSWIKSQLWAGEWPSFAGILDRPINAFAVPPDFFKGLAAVAPFSETGFIYFDAGIIRSHSNPDVGASYDVSGLPKGPVFSAKLLNLIKPYAETIDFLVNDDRGNRLIFYGKNIRGCIMGVRS